MKKSLLSLALCSLLLTTPHTANPLDISDILPYVSKIILPCGIAITIAGGIATGYCIYKEQKLTKQLDNLLKELDEELGPLAPKEAAALIPERQERKNLVPLLKRNISYYALALIAAGCITAIGLVITLAGGIWLYLDADGSIFSLDNLTNQHTKNEDRANIERKILLGGEVRRKIIQLKGAVWAAQELEKYLKEKQKTISKDQKIKFRKLIQKHTKKLAIHHKKHQQTLEEIDQMISEYQTIRISPKGYKIMNHETETALAQINSSITKHQDDESAMYRYLKQFE